MSKPTLAEKLTLLTEQELADLISVDQALDEAWTLYRFSKEQVRLYKPVSGGAEYTDPRAIEGARQLRVLPAQLNELTSRRVLLSLAALKLQRQRLIEGNGAPAAIAACWSWATDFSRVAEGRVPGAKGLTLSIDPTRPETWQANAVAHGLEAERVARLW